MPYRPPSSLTVGALGLGPLGMLPLRWRPLALSVLSGLSVVSGCAAETDGSADTAETATSSGQPSDWQQALEMASVTDADPAPDVVNITLEARVEGIEFIPGKTTPAWTYNGRVPGPMIRARVGDRLIVNFTNHLPEPTTIHWHGLRTPNAMDGVPHVTQDPVEPGETFVYDFVLKDAGTFWYHPHVNSVAQVGKGLYGALIVEDPAEPPMGDELVVVLSDMSLDDEGQFLSVDAGGELGDLFGREGTVLLVNGRVNPTLIARAGARQRWRVINAARTRYITLDFAGHTFTRIGGDAGLSTAAVDVVGPKLVPGQRADLLVVPLGTSGEEVQVRWLPTERGYGTTFKRDPKDLFKVRFAEGEPDTPGPAPVIERQITPIDWSGATEVLVEFTVDQFSSGMVMGINHIPYKDVVPLQAKVGETQVWKLVNNTDFAHPFHLHGYFFQVIDDNGEPVLPLEWKDTIDVPVDHVVRVAVRFDERPGTWMFHCHILDHAKAGMMALVTVSP